MVDNDRPRSDKKGLFWCNSLLHIVPTNLSNNDIYNNQLKLRSNLGVRQCLAFADLLWRFCLIFTLGRVWLMIVTVFSSCHTQIYINITQLPLPGLYIMTFVFVFRYSLTKLGNLSFPHRCIPIVKKSTITRSAINGAS